VNAVQVTIGIIFQPRLSTSTNGRHRRYSVTHCLRCTQKTHGGAFGCQVGHALTRLTRCGVSNATTQYTTHIRSIEPSWLVMDCTNPCIALEPRWADSLEAPWRRKRNRPRLISCALGSAGASRRNSLHDQREPDLDQAA
jgi:hypothetical protein